MGNHNYDYLEKIEKDSNEESPNIKNYEEISLDFSSFDRIICCKHCSINDLYIKRDRKKLLARDIDNIIHKIKSFFINSFLIDFIEKHSNKKNIKLKKIYGGFINNLKKMKT